MAKKSNSSNTAINPVTLQVTKNQTIKPRINTISFGNVRGAVRNVPLNGKWNLANVIAYKG